MPPGCANPFPTLPSLFRADGTGVAQGPRDFAISPCGGEPCLLVLVLYAHLSCLAHRVRCRWQPRPGHGRGVHDGRGQRQADEGLRAELPRAGGRAHRVTMHKVWTKHSSAWLQCGTTRALMIINAHIDKKSGGTAKGSAVRASTTYGQPRPSRPAERGGTASAARPSPWLAPSRQPAARAASTACRSSALIPLFRPRLRPRIAGSARQRGWGL